MSARIKRFGKIFALVVLVLAGFVLIGLIVTRVPAQDDQDGATTDGGAEAETVTLFEQDLNYVKSLLEAGDFRTANEILNQVIADAAPPVELSDTLADLARQYEKYDIDRSQALAEYVVENYKDTASAMEMRYLLDRYSIETLINEGDIESAITALDQFQTDHVNQNKLDRYVYRLTQRLERRGYSAEAAVTYDQFVEDFPESRYVADAQLRASQCDVITLLDAGDPEGAAEAIEQLQQNHVDHDKLVETLNEITVQYLDRGVYNTTVEMCQAYQQAYPEDKHQLQVLMNLASAKTYLDDKAGVFSAIDQMIDGLGAEERGITNALFFVASHYRSRGDYEGERRLYRHAAKRMETEEPTFYQNWMKIYSQIVSGRYTEVDGNLNQLFQNYSLDDKMVRYIYWLGDLFHRVGDKDRSCEVFQMATERWPTDEWGLSCRLALILIDPELDDVSRQTAMNQFVSDFGGHKHFAVLAFRTANGIYRNAIQKQKEGRRADAEKDLRSALACCELVDEQACQRSYLVIQQELGIVRAHCQYHLGLYNAAIASSEQFLSIWPNYANRHVFDMIIADSYRCLLNSDVLNDEEQMSAREEVASAYKRVWETAMNKRARAQASQKLGRFYMHLEQWEQAAQYLEYFLATEQNWGRARQNAIYALRQVYMHLGLPALADDVYLEFTRQSAEVDILGMDTRLMTLLGG